MVRIKIPSALRGRTDNKDTVEVAGETVKSCLADLVRQHPGVEKLLFKGGQISRLVNIYLGEENISFLDKEATPVPDNAEISIITAIAGG